MSVRVSDLCQKYGSPLYTGGWVTEDTIIAAGGGGRSATGIVNR
jgi:hypothetical protein